ncbi:bifunctional DNA-binding transcriptional regulator/O6-methylguanine-DNA methyltransferase Ada [Uliginosibacterium paludis]|uniref:Bifunctional DNA-binding transcriptional regulator/O6-methylguanine-DNA methyltransferase Ada n=1 Tax=Uliginosibacterium paludis TaxID=1615952 RepID=A0ABV2CSY3_9RHOO
MKLSQSSEEARWAAVCQRDAQAAGSFVYAVRSTGVFCRPGCPSRRPRRENTCFFDSPEAALAAGFRACLRCRPAASLCVDPHVALVEAACRSMAAADAPLLLAVLAERAGLSPHHFLRVFKKHTGLTPHAWAAGLRAGRLREALGEGMAVSEAIYHAGYNASSRFYEEADRVLGMTPGAFRAGGAKTRIRFGLGECALGAILVAASERGLCAIALGDAPEPLLRELESRFPKAELVGGDPGFEDWMAQVIGFVEAPGTGLHLPLDLRGTAFQLRVWQALSDIPPGSRLSYSELAARIGAPAAVRAVAGACAANTLAVAIPCHRVVRSDGGLSGYRWGVARKRALLDREAESR